MGGYFPEVRGAFGTLITSTNVFRLIICKTLDHATPIKLNSGIGHTKRLVEREFVKLHSPQLCTWIFTTKTTLVLAACS